MIFGKSMILATLAFLAVSGSGGMMEAPCDFRRHLPILTLTITENGKPVSRRLLLDSGCTASTLFSPSASLDGKQRRVNVKGLGSIEFCDRPDSILGPDLAKLLGEAKIEGLLGLDFFKSRDVLIDYKKQKVFLSKAPTHSAPVLPSKSFECVSLIEIPRGFGTTVVHSVKPLGVAIMLVDTGSDATCLPLSAAFHERPPEAKDTTMIAVNGPHAGWIEAGSVTLAGVAKPFPLDVWFVGDTLPTISPADLGSQVFFSLRNSEMYVSR